MSTFKVALDVSQIHTFVVEDAADAADAIRRAIASLSDGDSADDVGWPGIEVRNVVAGDEKIRFVHTLDYMNRDDLGVPRWKVTALEDRTSREVAEGRDVGTVANAAFRAVSS